MILTDTGKVLGNTLINLGIVNEISILAHPLIIGQKCYPMFSEVTTNLYRKLKKAERFENGCMWMVYITDI